MKDMVESKQVIVMRRFKSLRKGKYCSQSAHASVGALLSIGSVVGNRFVIPLFKPSVYDWITGRFTKIVCYVETEDELVAIYNKAKEADIATSLITDAGLTEFNGVHTLTAVGIGPDNGEKIDLITGHLPLF